MDERQQKIETTLALLNLRIERIENYLSGHGTLKTQAIDPTPKTQSVTSEPDQPNVFAKLGMSHLLAVVAVVCFVLAGSFIVKLAIDSGWLTPERQWASVVFLGLGFCSAGRFWTLIEKNYRSYLSSAGIVILYLAAFSSVRYFDVCSTHTAILMGMGVTSLSLALFHYHRVEIFPIVAAVGTYLSPVLIGRATEDFWMTAAYFILWSGVFSWFSTYFLSRSINMIAAYLGLGIFALLNMNVQETNLLLAIIFVQVIQFIIFASGVMRYSTRFHTPLSSSEAWGYFPVLCFFYGVTYHFLNKLHPQAAPWVALGFGRFLLWIYQGAKEKLEKVNKLESQQMIHSFLAIVLFHAGYLQLLPYDSKPWLLAVFLILSYVSEQKKSFPKVSRAFQILFIAIGFFEYLSICAKMLRSGDTNTLAAGLAALVIGIFYYLRRSSVLEARAGSFLAMVHILAILALYRLAVDYGSLYVSLAWGAYAIIILATGYSRKDILLARSSLVVLLIAALKALIYDASQAATGMRIVCLLLTGALLYGTGVLFQKMSTWKS